MILIMFSVPLYIAWDYYLDVKRKHEKPDFCAELSDAIWLLVVQFWSKTAAHFN